MANKVVIFPESKEAEALAYKVACDAHYASHYEPGGEFAYIRNDAFDQWVVPFYGPPWEFITGDGFQEPVECAALRGDGVLHDTAVWPEEEEE
jgi:hypothetical protein